MRPCLFLLAASSVLAQAPDAPPPRLDETTEAARAVESAAATKAVAESYRVAAAEAGGAALRLEPKSLLQWSNPVAGSFHGSVFLWTSRGRPAAIASIFRRYQPPPVALSLEFHSLAAGRVKAERRGKEEWAPDRGGVAFRPVPGAVAPADTPARRLRQLRAMAGEFAASETTREGIARPLRLLTQPIYRYEPADPGVLDGALFAFVEGTDPELFLLIEARLGDGGPAWHYALARMNSIEFRVEHRGRQVWTAPILSWSTAQDPREPYALLAVKPEEGPAGR